MRVRFHLYLTTLLLSVALSAAHSSPSFGEEGVGYPQLGWATAFGGPYTDSANDLAIDSEGSAIVVGKFVGTADFDPGPGVTPLTSAGYSDCYVAKFSPTGELIWVGQFSSVDNVDPVAVAVNGRDEVIVAGSFSREMDADPGPQTFSLGSYPGGRKLFVVELSSSGTFAWAVAVEGGVTPTAVSADREGNVVVGGQFSGNVDLDPGPGVQRFSSRGSDDGFVIDLDSSGDFQWAKTFGGTSRDRVFDLVRRSDGVLVVGQFWGVADFDVESGGSVLEATRGDGFVLHYGPTGEFRWVGQLSSTDLLTPTAISSLPVSAGIPGDIVVVGSFSGAADLDPGPGTYEPQGSGGFVLRLAEDGTFVWALPNLLPTTAVHAAVDSGGALYLAMGFDGTRDVAPGPEVFLVTSPQSESLVVRLTPSGRFDWAATLGGPLSSLAAGKDGVMVAGSFSHEGDFDPDLGTFLLQPSGLYDAFLVKLRHVAWLPKTWMVPSQKSTIQEAIEAAHYRDSVLVSPGIYYENVDFRGRQVAVRSAEGAAATVIDGSGADSVVKIWYSVGPAARLEGFTIRNGRASLGGGIYLISSAEIVGNIIEDNEACGGGAGIEIYLGSPVIRDNLIRRNRRTVGCAGGLGGGGIQVRSGEPTIVDNVISENDWKTGGRSEGGGISVYSTGRLTLRDNLIRDNQANQGGGVFLRTSSGLVVQNLIVRNLADSGGGLYLWVRGTEDMAILNNTVADNNAGDGAAAYVMGLRDGLRLINNILLGRDVPALACDSVRPEFLANLAYAPGLSPDGDSCGFAAGLEGNLSEPPRLIQHGPLAYQLRPRSPAIDAGILVDGVPTVDLQGEPRLIDGDRDGEVVVDIGADEFCPQPYRSCRGFRDGFESGDTTAWSERVP